MDRSNDIGEAARTKAIAPLGDDTWHPNERVERSEPIAMRNAGIEEEMFLLYTTSENILGARVNGRVLLAWSPDDTNDFEAGAFWVTEYGTKRLQSIYVTPLFRPQAGNVLAAALKHMGVKQTVGPYSPAGQAYVDRHKFRKVSNMIKYRGAEYRQADTGVFLDTLLRKCDQEVKRIMGTEKTPVSFRLRPGAYYTVGGIGGLDHDAYTHYASVIKLVMPELLPRLPGANDRSVLSELYHTYRQVLHGVEDYLSLNTRWSDLGEYRVDEQKTAGYSTNVYFVLHQ